MRMFFYFLTTYALLLTTPLQAQQVIYKWHRDTANHFCFQVPAKWAFMSDEDGLNNGYYYSTAKDIKEGKEPLFIIDGWLLKLDSNFMRQQGFSKSGNTYYTGEGTDVHAYRVDTAVVIKGANWKGYSHPATGQLFFYHKKYGIITITVSGQGFNDKVWQQIIKSFRFL
jgi:hypothetical protein